MATGISLAITAITAAVGAVSAYSSAKEQEKQLDYQAELAENEALKANYNKEIALEEAREEGRRGHENKIKERFETSQLIAKQRAEQAASNALLDTGSYLDVQVDLAEKGEQQALLEEQKGYDKQYQYLLQAQNAEYQASQHEDKALYNTSKSEKVKPENALASSLLGTTLKKGSSFNFFSE